MSYRAIVIAIFAVLGIAAGAIGLVSWEIGRYIEDVCHPYDDDDDE